MFESDFILFQASGRWEGDKLIIEYEPKVEGKGKAQSVTREIVDGQLVQVSTLSISHYRFRRAKWPATRLFVQRLVQARNT